MMFRVFQIISALVIPTLVSAHGYVQQVTIDGTVYMGNNLGIETPAPSIIRLVSTNDPVRGATNPDLFCGQQAQLAPLVGNANPGSQLQILWVDGPNASLNWLHFTGPLMHYMTKCDGSCTTYNSTSAEWFKIAELGLESDGRTWYQAALHAGFPVNVTIPSTLAPGQYLLRSEIISLQLAMTEGGAEFYPACIQLNIGGSQTQGPTSSEGCTFPGCYSDTDPGILTPNIYNPPIQYTFPGPPVASFISGGSNSSASLSSSASLGGYTPACSSLTGTSSPSAAHSTPVAEGMPSIVSRDSRTKRLRKWRLVRS